MHIMRIRREGNKDYENSDLVDFIFNVQFQHGIDETDQFAQDLAKLYTLAAQFSNALASVTNDKSASLIEFSELSEVPGKIITFIREKRGILNNEQALKQGYLYVDNAKAIADTLTKDVFQCMSNLRATQIPNGKPQFETIYNKIIVYLHEFKDDVRRIGGLGEHIEGRLHEFLNSELQPLIDDAGLNEPLKLKLNLIKLMLS